MPWVGQGLAGMHGAVTAASVATHIAAGFRSFDGAQAKEWYDDVAAGNALAAAIASSPLTRDDFFLASKVHPASLADVDGAVREMFAAWHLEADGAMDLVYLHYPECFDGIRDCAGRPRGDWRTAWRALERLYALGKVRALGVSNFDQAQLRELHAMAAVGPHVVQLWLDPFHQAAADVALIETTLGAHVVGYSSLGTQWPGQNPVWTNPELRRIADKHGATVADVVLAFFVQRRIGVVPRSTTAAHIQANARLLRGPHVALDDGDVAAIEALDGTWTATNDDDWGRVETGGE